MFLCIIYALSANVFLLCFFLCLFIIYEIYFAFRNRLFIAPDFLFTCGWTLPLLIAQYPVYKLVNIVEPSGYYGNLLSLSVLCVFYVVQIVKPRGKFNLGFDKIRISYWFPIIFFLISNLGFILALYSNNWIIPVFQVQVTDSAKDFFYFPGTSTIFNLATVGVIYTLLIFYKHEGKVSIKIKLLIFFIFLYLIELVLYGKRMGVMLFLIFILLSLIPLLSRRKIIKYGLYILIFFLANAFLRLGFAFKESSPVASFKEKKSASLPAN